MNCCDCEELIAAAARDGRTAEAAAGHLTGCDTCSEFAADMAAVAVALTNWEVPAPTHREAEAERAALLQRVARHRRLPGDGLWRHFLARLIEQPSLIAVAGAAAAAAGIAMAPTWVRLAAACWAGVAALLVSLVLMHDGHRAVWEGEQ